MCFISLFILDHTIRTIAEIEFQKLVIKFCHKMIEVQHLLGFKEKFILFRIYLCQSNVSPPIFPVRPKLKFNTNEKITNFVISYGNQIFSLQRKTK